MDHHGYETTTAQQLFLLDGTGSVLWQSKERVRTSPGIAHFRGERDTSQPPPTVDGQADVRVMALSDDGSSSIMLRAPDGHAYVVSEKAEYPDPMPPCLE